MFTYSALCFFSSPVSTLVFLTERKEGKLQVAKPVLPSWPPWWLPHPFILFIYFLTGPLWKMLSPLPSQRAVNEHNGERKISILAINTAFGTKQNILKGRLHLKPCILVHFPKIVREINYIISRSLNSLWVEVHRLSQISQTAFSFR